jgi:hypothetical protein
MPSIRVRLADEIPRYTEAHGGNENSEVCEIPSVRNLRPVPNLTYTTRIQDFPVINAAKPFLGQPTWQQHSPIYSTLQPKSSILTKLVLSDNSSKLKPCQHCRDRARAMEASGAMDLAGSGM